MLDTRRQLPERYPYGNSSNGHLLGQQISEPSCPNPYCNPPCKCMTLFSVEKEVCLARNQMFMGHVLRARVAD